MQNIVLVGFMGTGKTAVGKVLAGAIGMRFVDTDDLIESKTGSPIPEIFKSQGERAFRAIEQEVVRSLDGTVGHVIATGGGVVINPENVRLLKSLGPVIHLTATPEVILERTGGNADARPLLAGGDALQRIRSLLETRAPCYAQADVTIDTSTRDIYAVVQEVLDDVDDAVRRTIRVDLGADSYNIVIGESILARLGLILRQFDVTNRALIVTNPGLLNLYGETLEQSLRSTGFELSVAEVPDGEAQKSLEWAGRLYDAMLDHRMDRRSPVIALGGGVIGDLAGFVAATYMRGVPFIQAPTSLLAQVDASVGGKVAVDHARGKNLIGAFYQPDLVLISLDTLRTLSDREFRAGMAEVVKYGIIADEVFFDYVEQRLDTIMTRYPGAMAHIVARSCEIKADVVSGDEREQGRRAILNYGHTIGHAVEVHTGLLHGEAVAVGMVCAARIAEQMGALDRAAVDRIVRLLERIGLPTAPAHLDHQAILRTMMHDKKTIGGRLRFVLPTRIGEVEIRDDVTTEMIRRVL